MGKRAASGKGEVVIAEEIRKILEADNSLNGPAVLAVLKEKHPNVKFNDKSAQVAFSNARKKLGISRTVKRRPIGGGKIGVRPGRPSVSAAPRAAASGDVTFSLLQAAKELLQHCNGDANTAMAALKQIASLQMK